MTCGTRTRGPHRCGPCDPDRTADPQASRDAKVGERRGELSHLLVIRVGELRAAQEARSIIEGRYLDGQGALFPDVASTWDEQVRSTETIAAMAVRLAELEGASPAVLPEPEAVSRRTAELMADLVEPAKSTALEKLGEGRRPFGIANAWVRTKLASKVMADQD